jgi:hypothetical protein
MLDPCAGVDRANRLIDDVCPGIAANKYVPGNDSFGERRRRIATKAYSRTSIVDVLKATISDNQRRVAISLNSERVCPRIYVCEQTFAELAAEIRSYHWIEIPRAIGTEYAILY